MKKAYILIIGVLIGVTSTALAASSLFSDVQPGSYYYDAVQSASNKGLMTGYDNGYFGPDDTLNRAQMAVVMERYDEHILNTLKWQFGLNYVCPENNILTCTGGGPLGSGCKSKEYQDWMKANCDEIDILE